MNQFVHLFLILLSLICTTAHAAQEKGTGTLIVTYGTGPDAIRLNRVRFWLINSKGSYRLFPNNNIFVEDPVTKKRMVLIENLPEGNYTVKFVYPNQGGLLEHVEPKQVALGSSRVVKIDQEIRLRTEDIETIEGHNTYEIAYESPYVSKLAPLSEVRLYNRPPILAPGQAGYVNIKSNNQSARWVISKEGLRMATGSGSIMDLQLPIGSGYKLSTEDIPNYEVKILPTTTFQLVPDQTLTIEITYKRILGHIRVAATMPSSDQVGITIEGAGLKEPLQTKQIARGNHIDWKSPDLPLGTYVVTIKTPSYYGEVRPVQISLKQGQNVVVKPTLRGTNSLMVATNTSEAKFTLKQDNGPLVLEGYGNNFKFEGLFPGTYTLTFSIDNTSQFSPPAPMYISLPKFRMQAEEVSAVYGPPGALKEAPPQRIIAKPKVKGIADLYLDLVLVEGGPSILGDPHKKDTENTLPARELEISAFQICKYEVTNGQFADFLNAAINDQILYLSKDYDGVVLDSKDRPLFFTMQYASGSQISLNKQSENPFESLPGFEDYPVIFVSHFGAMAFCEYYALRLPTEAEWEKAAAIVNGPPLKKWIFGFSQDTIDRGWANYKSDVRSPPSKKVLTNPVGFYNGTNTLPLTAQDASPKSTENALSPVGAYDMSGNVFEWVQDWYADKPSVSPLEKDYQGPSSGKLKVAKGGCYDSLADGVRSFERIALNPRHQDPYTGFRVAKDIDY